MSQAITVVKLNPQRVEVWRYEGTLLKWDGPSILLEALFNRPDTPFMGTVLRTGDRFVEMYFTDRWYNIYEIHDRDTDEIKGWYCNIALPAELETPNRLSYTDLALDLWVSPQGIQTVLDEDEFAALDLDDETRTKARMALEHLQRQFREKMINDLFLR